MKSQDALLIPLVLSLGLFIGGCFADVHSTAAQIQTFTQDQLQDRQTHAILIDDGSWEGSLGTIAPKFVLNLNTTQIPYFGLLAYEETIILSVTITLFEFTKMA